MTPSATFTCNICSEPSGTICVYCTKDACANHLCDRCHRCSDCCECEIRLEDHPEYQHARVMMAHVEPETAIPLNGTYPAESTVADAEPEFEPDPAPEAEPQTATDEGVDATPAGAEETAAEPEVVEPVVPVEPDLPPHQE